jgi:hypothetical protein
MFLNFTMNPEWPAKQAISLQYRFDEDKRCGMSDMLRLV